MRILVVEDNEKMATYLKRALEGESYAVDVEHDGERGERMALLGSHDLIILDVMLPRKDGVAVCQALRAAGLMTPVVMLTARGEVEDRVLGLDSGADDYILKPFALEELLARMRALLRRPKEHTETAMTVRDVTLSPQDHGITKDGVHIPLTRKEYAVLEYLMRHADAVVTREQLLEHCWDFAYSAFSNITDVYIKQLRQKLGDDDYIHTIRGVGYTFRSH